MTTTTETTADGTAPAVPSAYELAMLLAEYLPRWRLYEGHFTSIDSCVRRTEGGVEIAVEVRLDYFAAGSPVQFVLRMSEPELISEDESGSETVEVST